MFMGFMQTQLSRKQHHCKKSTRTVYSRLAVTEEPEVAILDTTAVQVQ